MVNRDSGSAGSFVSAAFAENSKYCGFSLVLKPSNPPQIQL